LIKENKLPLIWYKGDEKKQYKVNELHTPASILCLICKKGKYHDKFSKCSSWGEVEHKRQSPSCYAKFDEILPLLNKAVSNKKKETPLVRQKKQDVPKNEIVYTKPDDSQLQKKMEELMLEITGYKEALEEKTQELDDKTEELEEEREKVQRMETELNKYIDKHGML